MIGLVHTKLARFAWLVLGYNLAVVAWGAYVRATGSGAGCGAHWPLCNAEWIPRAPSTEMLVEFSHRASSGLALIAVVALLIWAFRACEAGHPARRGAVLAMIFMLTEAALGAGLVLFQLVADNPSTAHALAMVAHLANTFGLLASLALTAYWAGGGADITLGLATPGRGRQIGILAAGLIGLVAVGKSGAAAAFGDTLYPVRTMAEGLSVDLSPTSNLLVRLRVLHPALALLVGALLVFVVARVKLPSAVPLGQLARRAVVVLAITEVHVGFLNLWLLAPVWMQMVHLLMADLLWIALVLLAASALAKPANHQGLA
jgi:cytochrome c oxidase assembly protein subunit 15